MKKLAVLVLAYVVCITLTSCLKTANNAPVVETHTPQTAQINDTTEVIRVFAMHDNTNRRRKEAEVFNNGH